MNKLRLWLNLRVLQRPLTTCIYHNPHSLSRSISTLETQLEVKLFDRHHNNVTPTLFGKYILDKGIFLLQEMKLLHRDLRLLRDNQTGEFHIGCGPFPAEMFIGDALAEFHSTHPKLNIHVAVNMTPQLLHSLRERVLDLFVADTRMILQEEELKTVKLKQRQAYFCCNKNHPLFDLQEAGVKNVLEYPYAFTGHRICCVSGHLKYTRTTACPGPCTCGTL